MKNPFSQPFFHLKFAQNSQNEKTGGGGEKKMWESEADESYLNGFGLGRSRPFAGPRDILGIFPFVRAARLDGPDLLVQDAGALAHGRLEKLLQRHGAQTGRAVLQGGPDFALLLWFFVQTWAGVGGMDSARFKVEIREVHAHPEETRQLGLGAEFTAVGTRKRNGKIMIGPLVAKFSAWLIDWMNRSMKIPLDQV